MNKNIITFIMAGGRGERLSPLTQDRTKPAVTFGGAYRIIDFTLSNCVNSGLRKVYVLTQYKSESLHRHIRLGWNIFSHVLGEFIDIIPAQKRVSENWYLGTADAVYQNLHTLQIERPSELLVLAGDHVYKMNYQKMIDFHRQAKADITIGVVEMDKSESPQLGVVDVDEKGAVIGFAEKPKVPKTIASDPNKIYASMGIYVFNTDRLEHELIEDAKNLTSHHDFGKDILPGMIRKGLKLVVYNFCAGCNKDAGYWRDIGTLDAYYQANMDLVAVQPSLNLYDHDWPIRTYQDPLPPAKTVHSGDETAGRIGQLLDSLVSNGCVISGGKVQRSILSPNVRINSFSEVYDSILMEGVNVGRYAKIKRAIIDKGVDIPKGIEIGYNLEEDKKKFAVTDSGIVVVAKGTQL